MQIAILVKEEKKEMIASTVVQFETIGSVFASWSCDQKHTKGNNKLNKLKHVIAGLMLYHLLCNKPLHYHHQQQQ